MKTMRTKPHLKNQVQSTLTDDWLNHLNIALDCTGSTESAWIRQAVIRTLVLDGYAPHPAQARINAARAS